MRPWALRSSTENGIEWVPLSIPATGSTYLGSVRRLLPPGRGSVALHRRGSQRGARCSPQAPVRGRWVAVCFLSTTEN